MRTNLGKLERKGVVGLLEVYFPNIALFINPNYFIESVCRVDPERSVDWIGSYIQQPFTSALNSNMRISKGTVETILPKLLLHHILSSRPSAKTP